MFGVVNCVRWQLVHALCPGKLGREELSAR